MFLVAFAYGLAVGFWVGFLWQPYLRRSEKTLPKDLSYQEAMDKFGRFAGLDSLTGEPADRGY